MSDIPPSAEDARPGEWTKVGAVSAEHGEILIIANHTVPPPTTGTRWDHWMAYAANNRERSQDRSVETFVADQYAPDWDAVISPAHAREDALIVRTFQSSVYIAEARTCDDPDHDGWCELRIHLHHHRPSGPHADDLSDLHADLFTMTDTERRELHEHTIREQPGTEPPDGDLG